MKKKLSIWNKLTGLGILSALALNMMAQDFHLSHYEVASQYMNPALTGMYFGEKVNWSATADYRSQWRSLSGKPFSTIYAAYDMQYKKQWGIGGYIINNRAGVENINTLNFILSGAYKINTGGKTSTPYDLTVGLQMGLLQKSSRPNNYFFDNQYSSSTVGGFDPSLPDGENFTSTSIFRFDANMGIYYKHHDPKQTVNPYGGFSIFHVTKPNQSFTGLKNKMPMRFVLNGGAEIKINDEFRVEPMILTMLQAKAFELNIGTLGYYRIKKTPYDPMLGFSYRHKDAVVIHMGLKHGNNLYRVSYDINTSSLKAYTAGRGAIEFSVIYTGSKKSNSSSLY